MSVSSTVFCYAEGEPGRWEAYCLTFDLAVRGGSFDEVRQKLQDQIQLYLEGVAAAPEGERARFLRRRAPWWAWLQPFGKMLMVALGRRDTKERHEFSFPIGDAAPA